ncbi:MAG: ATP-binding protein [Mobilitalea sp.]
MSKYLKNSLTVDAIYSEQKINAYKGNPFIEALPTFEESKDIYDLLKNPIPFQTDEKKENALIRRRCLTQLPQFFKPLGIHMDMAEFIINTIYHGYENRNPLNKDYVRKLNGLAICAKKHESDYSKFIGTNAEASGGCIIGLTSMGKSSCANRVCSGIPQKILHGKYKDEDIPRMQITWMKIDCPFDGTVKGLCENFLERFDVITGENTIKDYRYTSDIATHSMMIKMAVIACRHSLGVLIIDEFQNINQAKSGGKERMMNYILNLVNTIGVPVILMGVGEAIDKISDNLMYAKRTMGFAGMGKVSNLQFDLPDWDRLMKELWRYQWTKTETPLTPGLSSAVYMASAGIIHYAVKIFGLAQRKIITDDPSQNEILTVELIKIAYFSKEFKVERELIEKKIKSGEIQINVLKKRAQCKNDKKNNKNNNEMKTEYLVEDNLPGIIPRTNFDYHSKIAENLENNVEGGLHKQA